ncbi:MAG TPA: DUF177 domain-containing protein [Ruminiclostridium sp.]|nr:DUF177 domain-containing protein [Ruminiclostridium sp.]
MILDLKGVFDCEGYSRELSYDYDMSGYKDLSGEHPFKAPVKVEAKIRNRAGVVGLHVDTHFDYDTGCDRCCKPLHEHFDFAFDNVLSKQASGEGESGDIIVVEGDTFDLDELVASNVILNLPMKHLCSDDCKGLCPVCGKNLNEGECGCNRNNNSPFSQLLNLK